MNIIQKLSHTEKTSKLMEKNNIFTFICNAESNKIEIKKFIESKYKVSIENITSLVYKPKLKKQKYKGFTKKFKKIYVKLTPGQKIEIE